MRLFTLTNLPIDIGEQRVSLLTEKLVLMPFGIAAVEELLCLGVLRDGEIYSRAEVVDSLRRKFIELGGDRDTTAQQVIAPLKRVLDGHLFQRIRPGFYRYMGGRPLGGSRLMVREGEAGLASYAQRPPPRVADRDEARRTLPWPLVATAARDEIAALLRSSGRNKVADRLEHLQALAEDDPDEPAMDLDSLRRLALLLLGERAFPDPEIGVTPDGLALAQWQLPRSPSNEGGKGLLALEFIPSGLIRFAAVSAPYRQKAERLAVNGTLPPQNALEAMQPFTRLLVNQ